MLPERRKMRWYVALDVVACESRRHRRGGERRLQIRDGACSALHVGPPVDAAAFEMLVV
jgi:hypothetical protein